MLRKILLWILAIVITLSTAVYQRLTGPTHPIDGSAQVGGHTVTYSLLRTHGGEGGPDIILNSNSSAIRGILHYKRYNIEEPFVLQEMVYSGDSLIGSLPHQPPAGKLEYYVELTDPATDESIFVPGPQTVVIRFKGDVPVGALLPHVFLMFFGMLWSNRTRLEALSSKGKNLNRHMPRIKLCR